MNTLIKISQLAVQFAGAVVILRIMTEYEYAIYSASLQIASLILLMTFSPLTNYSFNTFTIDKVLVGQLLYFYRLLSFMTCLIVVLLILTGWYNDLIIYICATILVISINLYQFSLAYMSMSLSLRKSLLINLFYFTAIIIIAVTLYFEEFYLSAIEYVLIIAVLQVFLSYFMFRDLKSHAINQDFLKKLKNGKNFVRGQMFISALNWVAFQLPKIAILPMFNTEDYGAFMKIMLLPIVGIGAIETILHTTFIPKYFREKQLRKDDDKTDFMLFTLLVCSIGSIGMYFAEVTKVILLPHGLNTAYLMMFGFGLEIARAIINYTIINGYQNNKPDKFKNEYFVIIAISVLSMCLVMLHKNLFIYVMLIYVATIFYVPYFIFSRSLIRFDMTILLCSFPIVLGPILSGFNFSTFTWSLIFCMILLYELCIIFFSSWRAILFQYLRFN